MGRTHMFLCYVLLSGFRYFSDSKLQKVLRNSPPNITKNRDTEQMVLLPRGAKTPETFPHVFNLLQRYRYYRKSRLTIITVLTTHIYTRVKKSPN